MLFSSTFTNILLLGLPLAASAIYADIDEIPPDHKFKIIHVDLPSGVKDFKSKSHGKQRTERLAYYVDNGYAITGDINLGPEKRLLKYRKYKGISQKKGNGHNHARGEEVVTIDRRAISIFDNWNSAKWPGAELKYKYEDAEAELALKKMVDKAISHWLTAAPFFKFTQLPTSGKYELGTLRIIRTHGTSACWAPLGWCQGCDLTMSLDTATCNENTYVHEFGHALGLQHEHQRPDRGDYMDFNCSALVDYHHYGTAQSPCPGKPEKCCKSETCFGWACQFAFLDYLDYSGPLDLVSVMMYQEFSFSAGLYPTLIGINGNHVPNKEARNPSPGDGKRICDIYYEHCKTGVCGNGKKEGIEECDDGNTIDGDGCSSKCTIEEVEVSKRCTVCNPLPLENKCDFTTACVTPTDGKTMYCMCREGYKANPGYDSTTLTEWRLQLGDQASSVFVKPGIICNERCENWGNGGKDGVLCGEVPIKHYC